MIIRLEDIGISHLPEFKGGTKEFAAHMFFDGTNRIFKGHLIPGASIGMHAHEDSCEVIFILSGSGLIYEMEPGEKEAVCTPVSAGDCLYCPKGHSHSLQNPEAADCELVFYAVVPRQ